MYIIHGNYGNHTIALIQWAFEHGLSNVWVVSTSTDWEAEDWSVRVEQGEKLAKSYGFQVVRLKPPFGFSQLVRDRKEFPSQKFQWCASFLKGLPFLTWLDEQDGDHSAAILYGKRRKDSRANFELPERVSISEHHGERKIWYPLCHFNDEQFLILIKKTGLDILKTRSLECSACIHDSNQDLLRLSKANIKKLKLLENELKQPMFERFIEEILAKTNLINELMMKKNSLELFDMGCGAIFGCGE